MIDFISIPEVRLKKLKRSKKLIKKLEDLSGVKIEIDEQILIDSDDPIQTMRVKEVIKAFGRGFDFEAALYLLDDEYALCIIDVKEFSGKSGNRLNELRGRIIGKEGKTKNIIEKLADVKLSIYGKTASIIGKWNSIEPAKEAICMLLQGRKHGSVYRFLQETLKSKNKNNESVR